MIGILRSYHIAGIAVFDVAVTLLSSVVLSKLTSNTDVSLAYFVILVIMAIFVHSMTNTATMLNYYIGINTLDEVMAGRVSRGESL
jgi:hypothetical protein